MHFVLKSDFYPLIMRFIICQLYWTLYILKISQKSQILSKCFQKAGNKKRTRHGMGEEDIFLTTNFPNHILFKLIPSVLGVG